MGDQNGVEFRYCIVGNIIGDHYWGEEKEIKSGTKHFRAGTKVYCVLEFGGNGHESIRVLGKPRKSFRMVDVIIRSSYIKNFRLEKVYTPRIIDFLNKHGWSKNAEEVAGWGMDWLNERHKTIELTAKGLSNND